MTAAAASNASTDSADPLLQTLGAPLTPLADHSLSFLVTSLAARLTRGATHYYQRHFDIGMADFRVVMALGLARGLNVGEVAQAADIDKAAASRSLNLLQGRGLVQMEQTSTRGRAAIVHLTPAGETFAQEIRSAAQSRERRFSAGLAPAERATAASLLRQLLGNVPAMNQD